MKIKIVSTLWLLFALTGCAAYQAEPLDTRAALAHQMPHVKVDIAKIPLPQPMTWRFNPSDGLDGNEVAILAVVNNPQLILARDDAKVARAQSFAAGLLPDPQVSLGVDVPTNDIPGSNYTAYNIGLNYDLTTLLTHRVAASAAGASARQADLNLLWQEWQVASRARVLFTESQMTGRRLQILTESHRLLADRYARIRRALEQGNVTLDTADADLVALQDIDRQINDLERQANKSRHQLNQLLGLSPEVQLHLVGEMELPPLDEAGIKAAMDQLAERRPDLLALQAGYQSQDLHYRQAILEQFPALTIGVTGARDVSDVHTIGMGISLSLPLFNRNQGRIAVEKVTRQRLYDEFETRLMLARGAIEEILSDQRLLDTQLADIQAAVPLLKQSVDNTREAFKAGNIDERTYVALHTELTNKEIEQLSLQQTALSQRITLQTLLGADLPVHRHDK